MSRPALTDLQWQVLSERIAAYSGVALDSSRLRSVESALAVRLEARGLQHLEQYLWRLDDDELHALVELLVNHETQFFRTPAHYRALAEHLLPELHRARTPGLPIRCWSAGCATGEEPYSLAITALNTLPASRPCEIHGTDLSNRALERARAAQYRSRAVSNVAPADLERYFRPAGDSWQLVPLVKNNVVFEQHNLLTELPRWAQALDIVLCQNVTIYFALETCRALISRLFDALAPGGYLFLGYSETLWRMFDRFETVEVGGAFVYRKPAAPLSAPAPAPRAPARPLRAVPPPPPVTDAEWLQQGRELLAAGKLDQAVEVLRHVAPAAPEYPQALAVIAQVHANRGDWELAAAEATRALELDILTGDAHVLLGVVSAQQSRWPAALEHLLRAQYLDPSAPLPSFHLADVYRRQQRHDLAVREYRVTLRKLEALPSGLLLEGVSVGWLRETCVRYVQQLERSGRRH